MFSFANPIITRELITQLRVPRAFVYLFSLLAISCTVFCGVYAVVSQSWSIDNYDGRQIFFPMIYLALLIAVPISTMAASSIVREREEESLDLLMTTPMRRSSILWGKFSASLVYALLIFMSLLPFYSLSYLFGGLSSNELAQCIFVLVSFYCAAVMIGVSISMISVSTNAASRYTIVTLIMIYLGPYVARIFLSFFLGYYTTFSMAFSLDSFINPIAAIYLIHQADVTNQVMMQISATQDMGNFYVSLLVYGLRNPGFMAGTLNLLVAASLYIACSIIFRVFSNRLSTRFNYRGVLPALKRTVFRRKTRVLNLLPVQDPVFEDASNAVYQKENLSLNRRFLSRERNIIYGSIAVTAGVTWFGLYMITPELDEIPLYLLHYLMSVFGVIIAGLFAPVMPSNSVSEEFRKETWDILRTTTLKSKDIVQGKVYSAFRQAAVPLVGIMLTCYFAFVSFYTVYGVVLDSYFVLHTVFLVGFFLACAFFYCSIGVLFSCKTKRKRSSPHRAAFSVILFHYALPYLIYALVPIVLFLALRLPERELEVWAGFISSYLFPLSPVWIIGEWSWGFMHFIYIAIHSLILYALGLILIHSASYEIKQIE